MKFAKELENHLVPEWRAKYLDYKVGKKKIKAIQRALRNAQSSTPRTPQLLRRGKDNLPTPHDVAPQYSYLNRDTPRLHDARQGPQGEDLTRPAPASEPPPSIARDFAKTPSPSKPIDSNKGYNTFPRSNRSHRNSIEHNDDTETSPLIDSADAETREAMQRRGLTRYGSIIGSPPRDSDRSFRGRGPPSLDLPGPALGPTKSRESKAGSNLHLATSAEDADKDTPKSNGNGVHKKKTSYRTPLSLRHRSIFHPQRMNSDPHISRNADNRKPMMRRLLSLGNHHAAASQGEFPMAAYKDVDVRQGEFFNFLDVELEKVEDFYRSKEDDATKRLEVLRQQLHIMRDRRVEEILQARTDAMKNPPKKGEDENGYLAVKTDEIISKLDETYNNVVHGKIGKRSKALEHLTSSAYPDTKSAANQEEPWNRDYVRRVKNSHMPYHTARRKLKLALQEYYRGLELLKSYALLNQKAFRKINKKYDKAVNARPSLRYMNEKVNTAYFVTSDVVDGHLRMIEDLYARYFEGGNHKVAAGKLRAKSARSADYTSVVFRNGLYLATGLVFGVEGLVYAGQIIEGSDDAALALNASYLMQIYAGYFLMLILMLMFILDCRLWSKAKVNYAFIFEFDNRSLLDWHELAELPCFFLFMLGFFLWINFSQYGTDAMFIYYPVLLVGITFIILFNPLPIIYPRTRQWFLTANWRLFFSGLYPVEFRDFFLGDMFCSLTYAMGNISLFFCIYAHLLPNDVGFQNPGQCNSRNSRLLGFFTTLPGIWRALQCLRRYKDTRNAFPHLANFGKYMMTICFYMSLSLWRIDNTFHMKALFIFFATVNSVYCSIWDLVMDWSLLDPYSHPRLLRDHLAFKSTWIYYAAMVIDPILRFNWIFYAIFGNEIQHSALLSFFVSLSEVGRRGIWTIFRVENEHCTNVGRFRASRDVPLPYKIRKTHEERLAEMQGQDPNLPQSEEGYLDPDETEEDEEAAAREEENRRQGVSISPSLSRNRSRASGADMLTRQRTQDSEATLRLRREHRQQMNAGSPMMRAMSFVGSLLHTAHAQDFERKKRPDAVSGDGDKKAEESDTDTDVDEDGPDQDEGTDQEEEVSIKAAKDVEMLAEASGTSSENDGEHQGSSGIKGKHKLKKAIASGDVFSFQPKRQPDESNTAQRQPEHGHEDSSDDPVSPNADLPGHAKFVEPREEDEDTKGKEPRSNKD